MQAPRDVAPLHGGGGGHEVQDGTYFLCRRGDVVEVGQIEAGVVDLHLEPEAFAHRVERNGVDVVGG